MGVRLLPGRVLPAVQLDDEAVFETHEIDDEAAQGMLAAELEPGKLAVAQVAPKQTLRVGGPLTQVSGSIRGYHKRERITRGHPLTPALSPAGRGRTKKQKFPSPACGRGRGPRQREGEGAYSSRANTSSRVRCSGLKLSSEIR